jgi:hypothetical protein
VSDLLGLVGVLMAFMLPLLLAWWLLGRDERRARRRQREGVHGKIANRHH